MKLISYPFAFVLLISTTTLFGISYFFRISEYNLIESKNELSFLPFNDSTEKGNSLVKLMLDTGNSVQMTYELRKGYEYPFTGFSVESPVDSQFLNLSKFKFFNIKLKADKAKKIPISINSYCEGFSKTNVQNSLIPYVFYLDYNPKIEEYEIPLDKFLIPNWWYLENKIADGSKLNCKFEKVKSINIESCSFIKTNTQDKINVYNMTFIYYKNWHWIILLIGCLGSFTILIFLYTKRKKTVFIPYQSTPEHIKKGLNPEQEVLEYLANNYSNSELSMAIIYKETGIPETKIASVIKSETGLSFKQYLNDFRIAEAKRLLTNHSLSISEIAYRVGYNNVTHFNRVFKSETNISPGDFRSSN